MSGWIKFFIYVTCLLCLSLKLSNSGERKFNLGELATKDEIAGWDIDVRPDGLGAPIGSGDAISGEEIYAERCGFCHGDFGEGIDRWPELIGGEDSLDSHDPIKTTSSYWPYASTMYDYIYRAMPFGEAQSLTVNETYNIVAYLLYMGDIIEEEFELSNENIGAINMPNKNGFLLPDPRPDVSNFDQPICMNNCNSPEKIIGRARDLDVTPEDEN